MRDDTKLRAFVLADEIVEMVYETTAHFPKEELCGLTAQMRWAAVSVPSNIVEGCSRDSQVDFLRFFTLHLGFMKIEPLRNLEPKMIEAEKALNGLMTLLRRKSRFSTFHLNKEV